MVTVAALALASGALDAQHVELSLDVAKGEIGAGHGGLSHRYCRANATRIPAPKKP
jgi:hypothetical protein